MRPAEKGFLLLTCHLADPSCRPLTVAQFRSLAHRVRLLEKPTQQRLLTAEDLIALGYGREEAERILYLLSREQQLACYLKQGEARQCVPLSRISCHYPARLRARLGLDSPGCFWAKGDVSLLAQPCVALVGSRQLCDYNRRFAEEAGAQAAKQGYVLVSGNARGADRAAQDSCLNHGGKVICVVADSLEKCPSHPDILYLSEEGYELAFSAQRAHSRNRVIHALAELTVVAQCAQGKGGTWSGAVQNLRCGWSPVFCFDDRTQATKALCQKGATPIGQEMLSDYSALTDGLISFL